MNEKWRIAIVLLGLPCASWADKFLATPAAGIEDSFVRLAYRREALGPLSALTVAAVFHDFDANAGRAHYGDEWDLSIVARTGRFGVTLKYAAYDADELMSDTDKLWLSMDYAF